MSLLLFRFIAILLTLNSIHTDHVSVSISAREHVNIVSDKFLSFTVDPKFLFSNNEGKLGKDCLCMATALSPAYIRIAGPSTAQMDFRNATLVLNATGNSHAEDTGSSLLHPQNKDTAPVHSPTQTSDLKSSLRENLTQFQKELTDLERPKNETANPALIQKEGTDSNENADSQKEANTLEEASLHSQKKTGNFSHLRTEVSGKRLSVDLDAWQRFASWAEKNRFELVFALNSDGKTEAGIWDPNTALSILSVAEKANIGKMVWQLGYECRNRSTEEYLDELKTLRVVVDTFPAGRSGGWRVISGDVTACLAADSKSSFSDYLVSSDDMLDAVFLNGNSSSAELEKLKDSDRESLLRKLSNSSTPLWITESRDNFSELERAADWLTSLGLSARSGFDVHFRELREDELYEPTLSFYMSLLFKNLVGNRVLGVDVQDVTDKASLFAHCTTLKHQPVPGAITLFGSNMDDEAVRFSIKLSKREEGGDIMQFVLSQDRNGNTIVNGLPMFYEGDIKPVVKRVRPYKTLLITLPPRSFGFWVLANTNIEACHEHDEDITGQTLLPAIPVEYIQNRMTFAHKDFQSRRKREIPLFKNDVILHKWIGDNKIFKIKDDSSPSAETDEIEVNPFDEINDLTKNVIDLQKVLAEVKNMVETDSFIDNVLRKSRDMYDSESKDELELKHFFRQKRQILGEHLNAAVSKLKTGPGKNGLTRLKPTTMNLKTSMMTKKLNEETKEISAKDIKDSKKLLKKTEKLENENNVQKFEVSKTPAKAGAIPKRILDDSKVRVQQLKSRLQARRDKDVLKTAQIKKGFQTSKRSTEENEKQKINLKYNSQIKPSQDLALTKDGFAQNHDVIRKPTRVISVFDRKKRSSHGIIQPINSLLHDLKNPYGNKKEENSDKSVLKTFLHKINDHLDVPSITEISEESDIIDENKVMSNNVPKKRLQDMENKDFEDQILLKTKISDEDASIIIDEKSSKHGLIKNTFESVSSFLEDLKENFARIWADIPNFDL